MVPPFTVGDFPLAEHISLNFPVHLSARVFLGPLNNICVYRNTEDSYFKYNMYPSTRYKDNISLLITLEFQPYRSYYL